MNRLLARVAGIETRAAQIARPDNAPTSALALRYGNPEQPMYPRQNSDSAVEWGYWANLYAFRCINTIASTIAGLPFRAGAEYNGEPDSTAVLSQLLGPAPGGPNRYWSSALLWKWTIAQWLIMGRWGWLKQLDDAKNLAGVFPLQAQGLFPVPALSGDSPFERFEYLRGTPYYRDIFPDQLAYCWNPSQSDWRQPESVLGPAAKTVNLMKLLEDFDTSFLTNGGVPAYLVTTDAFAQSDDRARFRRQFQRFAGAAQAGQTMFAERVYDAGEGGTTTPNDPVHIDTIGINQRDAELSVLRDSKIRDLCVSFGVPLSLLGDSSLTRFHQTAEDRQFYYTETIAPLCDALADQVNISLGADLQEYGWFETSGIRELARERVFTNDAVAVGLVSSNMITRDEWRADAGLPPAKDVGLTKAVTVPTTERVTDPLKAPQPASNGATPPPTPAVAPDSAPLALARANVKDALFGASFDIRAIAAARRGGSDYERNQNEERQGTIVPLDETFPNGKVSGDRNDLRHAGVDGHTHGISSGHITLGTLQQAFTVKLRRFLAQQTDAVGKRLSGRRNRTVRAAMTGNVEALFDTGFWITEGTRLFPEHVDAIREAMLRTTADLAEAIRSGATDDALLAVIEASASHYRLAA